MPEPNTITGLLSGSPVWCEIGDEIYAQIEVWQGFGGDRRFVRVSREEAERLICEPPPIGGMQTISILPDDD